MFRISLVGLMMLAVPAVAADLSSDQSKFSYTMGVRLGQILKSQGVTDVQPEAVADGIADFLRGDKLKLKPEEMVAAIRARQAKKDAEKKAKAVENLAAGRAFMLENAKRDGVKSLPNGMQYEVLKAGKGDKVGADAKVKVHYHGTLADGTVFDSSVKRGKPVEFALGGVIPGFREAIQRMQPGAKWKVYLPPELAYGERGAPPKIGPNATLIFEIELLQVMPAEPAPAPAAKAEPAKPKADKK